MKKAMILGVCVMMVAASSCGGREEAPEVPEEEPEEAVVADEAYAAEMGMGYLEALFGGRYAEAYSAFPHDAAMTSAVSPERYEEIILGLVAQNGAFKGFKGTEAKNQGAYLIFTSGVLFESGALNANVVFDGTGAIAGLNFGLYTFGEAALPEGIRETEISFGKEGWELPGRVTFPIGDGPYPLLILVHGSGPNNMNETVGMNEPFKDLAHGLAQRGVAVLRYDKRTFAHGGKLKDLSAFTVYEETVEDAMLAASFGETMEDVDPMRIYILGHSLGGYLIPRIAEKTPRAAGYIMAAGISSSLGEILPYQIEYLAGLDGTVTQEEQEEIEQSKLQAQKLSNPQTIGEEEVVLGARKAYWTDLAAYNPVDSAAAIDKPVFVLQGDRDYQVPVAEFERLREALEGKSNYTFKLYPGLNHLLMAGEGTPGPKEYFIKNSVDGGLLDDLAAYIRKGGLE